MQITDKVIREERECLNCGEVSEGLFCNNCGQSMETPQRITMKTFGKGVAMSFARLTPGFWATFVGLTLCPWDVIREYLHGKRVKYSPPITMVIQLLLYFTLLYTFLGDFLNFDFYVDDNDGAFDRTLEKYWLLRVILSSDVIVKFLVALPISYSCYLAYRSAGSHRYNFAEYITAAIYMGCSFAIYNNLLARPIGLLNPDVANYIKTGIVLIIGTLSLFNAFPVKSFWRRWWLWLKFMFLNICWILIFVVLYMIIQ